MDVKAKKTKMKAKRTESGKFISPSTTLGVTGEEPEKVSIATSLIAEEERADVTTREEAVDESLKLGADVTTREEAVDESLKLGAVVTTREEAVNESLDVTT